MQTQYRLIHSQMGQYCNLEMPVMTSDLVALDALPPAFAKRETVASETLRVPLCLLPLITGIAFQHGRLLSVIQLALRRRTRRSSLLDHPHQHYIMSGNPRCEAVCKRANVVGRSEERRVGKECRSRW